jgi:hypothetical protein
MVYNAGMTEETAEQKLARYETVLDLQMKELDRLRAENERLRTVAGAHGVLKEIYLDPDAPQGNRIKAAQAALPHETPRLTPVPPPLDLVAEEYEPLADVIARQRARCDRMQREARDIEVLPSGFVRVLPKPGSNGSGDDHS